MLVQEGVLFEMGDLAASQEGHILFRTPPLFPQFNFHSLLFLPNLLRSHGFRPGPFFSLSDLPSHLPQSSYSQASLYLSPCLSIFLSHTAPPNHSHHSLVKRWRKQALVFDGQTLHADISLWSTLSVAKLGRVEWQPAFSGCVFCLW